MRKYLATLHTKPDHHKKRFAFLASATFTLAIFGMWSLVTFGPLSSGEPQVAARAGFVEPRLALENETEAETVVTPFDSLGSGVAAAFSALGDRFKELIGIVDTEAFKGEYVEMRNDTLRNYGP